MVSQYFTTCLLTKLSLPYETSFEANSAHSFDFTGNFVVAINQPNGTSLHPSFENLSPFQREVFNEHDAVAVRESVSIRIFYYFDGLGLSLARPFMAASHAFPFLGVLQDFVHLAFRTDFLAHLKMIGSEEDASSFRVSGVRPFEKRRQVCLINARSTSFSLSALE